MAGPYQVIKTRAEDGSTLAQVVGPWVKSRPIRGDDAGGKLADLAELLNLAYAAGVTSQERTVAR